MIFNIAYLIFKYIKEYQVDCEWNENDEYDQRAAERRFDQEFGDIVDGIPWICDSSCHTYLKSMIFLLGVTASC